MGGTNERVEKALDGTNSLKRSLRAAHDDLRLFVVEDVGVLEGARVDFIIITLDGDQGRPANYGGTRITQ